MPTEHIRDPIGRRHDSMEVDFLEVPPGGSRLAHCATFILAVVNTPLFGIASRPNRMPFQRQ